jgi:hypothetical protein
MGMNTNNRGLSTMANGQLERMIDDAAWLTYPLHLVVGLLKTFVYTLLFISFLVLVFFVWMFTAHDDRAELTKNFVNEQSIYRVSFVNASATVVKQGSEYHDTDDIESGGDFKAMAPFGLGDWLPEKSDVFQSAYIAASCNTAKLADHLKEAKGDSSRLPDMSNAPVVLVSFLKSTDYDKKNPASAQQNWFTGMCLASANCTDEDFVPRNTSIWYDAIAPELTDNQDAAVKALYATGSPEFWVAAAHANGIYNMDTDFASYAADAKASQMWGNKLQHPIPPSNDFAHEVEIGIGLYVAFFALLCACFTRRKHKFNDFCEN